ncbi:MAG: FAD:protein FMN transferase [Oryzihumus sp.]
MLRSFVRWDALGTYAFLATEDPRHLQRAERVARAVLTAVDRTCSRFRADSDLSRANRHAGRWVGVDRLLVAATSVALEAATDTDGLVDPCLGRVLVSLGYDADLDAVRRRTSPVSRMPVRHRPDAWREVLVDPDGALRVPAGCALDLGATAKAWAGDLVARAVADELGCRVVVSLGGDVRVDGPDGDTGPGWPVLVTELPGDDEPGEAVHLGAGGLATSSTMARRWRDGDRVHHHLVDPRTGWPVEEVWRTVTTTGPTCTAANTASTAALVLGGRAVQWLERRGIAARLVAADGTVRRLGGWPAADATPALPSPGPRRSR